MTDDSVGNTSNSELEGVWEIGWEGHRVAQLRRWARWTMAEKLAWLEEAHYFVLQMERVREEGRAGGSFRAGTGTLKD